MLAVRHECSAQETALMLAARGGNAEAVQLLIEAGANVNLRNQVAKFLIPQRGCAIKYCLTQASSCLCVLVAE